MKTPKELMLRASAAISEAALTIPELDTSAPFMPLTFDEVARLEPIVRLATQAGVELGYINLSRCYGGTRAAVAHVGTNQSISVYVQEGLDTLAYTYSSLDALLTAHKKQYKLFSDGIYWIEANDTYSEREKANGFLLKACEVTVTTPGGYACIGGYDFKADNVWQADISQLPTPETDCMTVYQGNKWLNCVAALWIRRFEAYCDGR